MPWKRTDAVTERKLFVGAVKSATSTFTSVCALFGIERQTGYKWWNAYREHGFAGLEERSRRPHSNSRAIDPKIVSRIVKLKRRYPNWGPRKLVDWFEEFEPGLELPAASTIGEYLKARGLVSPRPERKRWRGSARSAPLRDATFPNATWSMDFKGWFRLGDRRACHPFTVTDNFSRFLIDVKALENERGEGVWKALLRVFGEFGLPNAIRMDNGQPWVAPKGGLHLTTLSAKLLRLGISLERIDGGKPQQNGRHERMHLTLKQDTAQPPAANLPAQQRRFNKFRSVYNEVRPHESVHGRPPATLFRPSRKPFRGTVPEPVYTDAATVHRVNSNGKLRIRGREYFLSTALNRELVGVLEIEEGCFEIRFCDEILGQFHDAHPKLGLVVS
jgi:transposase InsO family protein